MTEKEKKKSNGPLLALIFMCAFPYLAATVYYQYKDDYPIGNTLNYGEFVSPVIQLEKITFKTLGGEEKSIESFRKKWLMFYVASGECEKICLENLYFMRQVRKALAEDRFRINRLLILDDEQTAKANIEKIQKHYSSLEITHVVNKEEFYKTISADERQAKGHIMLVDPLGNLMMYYNESPEPSKMLKDIQRLLKISRIG